ncbi:MAG TPA: ferredoxin--NADP reductase [Cyclobacteriaceae bacterium]
MNFSFTIEKIIQETPDIRSFVLSPNQPFHYKPGQFLTIVKGDVRRSFSFSSHPGDALPRITLKRIPNGEISRWMFDSLNVGDKINTIKASGLFTYPEDTSAYDTVMFFAAGSGITPVIPLMREALSRNDGVKIVLVYSSRSRDQVIFLKELDDLQKLHPDRLIVIHYLSNSMDLELARFSRRALEALVEKYMTTPSRMLFYLCGPHVYMQNITITLLTEGIPDENIRREIFFNPEPPITNLPPDTDMHTVNVHYEGQTYRLKVQFPKSILQTAKAQGIMLPYSCEAGRCGTCAGTCTRGEVWMLRNEVLLDKEMAKGRALTCTGYPVGGDVDITITG